MCKSKTPSDHARATAQVCYSVQQLLPAPCVLGTRQRTLFVFIQLSYMNYPFIQKNSRCKRLLITIYGFSYIRFMGGVAVALLLLLLPFAQKYCGGWQDSTVHTACCFRIGPTYSATIMGPISYAYKKNQGPWQGEKETEELIKETKENWNNYKRT